LINREEKEGRKVRAKRAKRNPYDSCRHDLRSRTQHLKRGFGNELNLTEVKIAQSLHKFTEVDLTSPWISVDSVFPREPTSAQNRF
jgi:hypothetical protein